MSQLLLALLSSGAVNSIYGTLIISLVIIFVVPVFRRRRIQLNALTSPAFWLLFSFGLIYTVIGDFTIRGFEYYLIAPVLAYTAGWCAIENGKKGRRSIVNFLAFIIIGYGVHALLNYSINVGRVRWELQDFFSGQLRAATGSGCINTLILSVFTYLILIEKKRALKVAGLALFIIGVLYALLLGTRTQFIIFALVNGVTLISIEIEKHGARGGIWVFAIFAVIAGICFYLYTNDVLGIKTYIDASNLLQRGFGSRALQESDQHRISSIFRGFTTMFDHPFGGLINESYYHNMWLDIGRVAGLMPFLIVTSYSIVTFAHVIRIFFDRTNEARIRYLLLSVYLGVMLNFSVEPIMEGSLDFFLIFCFINGMVECYYARRNVKSEVCCEGRAY